MTDRPPPRHGPDSETRAPILVPVDFSRHSMAALIWGAKTADMFDCPLKVLHVVHDPESAPGYYQQHNRHWQHAEVAARELMHQFLDRAIERAPDLAALRHAELHLVMGLPVNRILEFAEDQGAGLLVMGSQGLSGLPKLLLGSKAQRVVQLSPIPVTIVKAEKTDMEEVTR